jgi:signal transduction histidine kinase
MKLPQHLFYAANIAAMQLEADGRFSLIDRAPQWLHRFCHQETVQPCRLDPHNSFSFPGNFMHDAHEFWNREKVGCIKSGMWIASDEAGKAHFLEATALYTGRSKILLISEEHRASIENQGLIQDGRETARQQSLLERTRSERRDARDNLEARVRERNHELERINARLARELEHRRQYETERNETVLYMQQARKMEAIGDLAGRIAHDFNNILSAVMGYTELSLLDAPQGSSLANNLRHVLSAAQRAKKLIGQILAFSRRTNPETRPVQLAAIVNQAVEHLRASLTAAIEIRQGLASDAYVMADPSQLHQVVVNLCTNAIQAMQPDGGILKLTLKEYEIGAAGSSDFPDMPPGSYLEMTIADTGTGIPPSALDRIYDPFFTAGQKGSGIGMGLSVVHGIVKKCKGEITVASKVGEGTTFRIILPTTTRRHTSGD